MSLDNRSGQLEPLDSPGRVLRRLRPRKFRNARTENLNQAPIGSVQPHSSASPSPNHSILVPEILYDIFEYIYEDIVDAEGAATGVSASRRTLASAACTCKAFCVPALDILWRRLPGAWPLVRIANHTDRHGKVSTSHHHPHLHIESLFFTSG